MMKNQANRGRARPLAPAGMVAMAWWASECTRPLPWMQEAQPTSKAHASFTAWARARAVRVPPVDEFVGLMRQWGLRTPTRAGWQYEFLDRLRYDRTLGEAEVEMWARGAAPAGHSWLSSLHSATGEVYEAYVGEVGGVRPTLRRGEFLRAWDRYKVAAGEERRVQGWNAANEEVL